MSCHNRILSFFLKKYICYSGGWKIKICFNGEEIEGSPYDLNVYDPSQAKVIRSHFGPVQPHNSYSFEGKGTAFIRPIHLLIRGKRNLLSTLHETSKDILFYWVGIKAID